MVYMWINSNYKQFQQLLEYMQNTCSNPINHTPQVSNIIFNSTVIWNTEQLTAHFLYTLYQATDTFNVAMTTSLACSSPSK
jgi:hypothetical protein